MFPENHIPRIYAYTDTRFEGQIKVGYTNKTAKDRVKEQMESVKMPHRSWEIVIDELATREDGTFFTDHEIHRRLQQKGIRNTSGEWYACGVEEVEACILAEKKGIRNEENRRVSFPMRPEQAEAVQKTANFFREYPLEKEGYAPHFLWNAKMRFGKTFATYQLALEMGWKKLLVLTFKPAVQVAWREDLLSHIDFEGWQFSSNKAEDLNPKDLNKDKPFVFFASFQDILGVKKDTIEPKGHNEWIHEEDWDCVVFDEYHYGAWRDNNKFENKAKGKKKKSENDAYIGSDIDANEENSAYQKQLKDLENDNEKKDGADVLERRLPISTRHYLYLTGTPFRAIGEGEFLEDAIYSWTYTDEQRAKENWDNQQGKNPYEALPKMVMMTYQLPEEVRHIAEQGEFNEFDLNEFFKAEGEGEEATFFHEEEVQKWLSIIRGQYNIAESLQQGKSEKPYLPFENVQLLGALRHSFWYMPSVASCFAMANLLAMPQNTFYHDYQVIVCAGDEGGVGEDAFKYVKAKMGNPLNTKSITLSCGKLTTGVSMPPWSGILVLRNIQSPETYFQTIFRVQTPWVIKNKDKTAPNKEEIIKQQCYVFDFSPNRAFKQVVSYAENLDLGRERGVQEKIAELIKFLPIWAYDGSSMESIDTGGVLDYAMGNTTGTLLAKRWNSAKLVNVDVNTFARIEFNQEILDILEKIEGFRNIKEDVESLAKGGRSKEKKPKKPNPGIEPEEDGETPQKKKERTNKRQEYQKKLKQFATRIPIFMYLSEYREHTLRDVITKLEAELFEKVTGITQSDFEKLEKVGLFNSTKMDAAVFGFKRFEDSSLSYTGIDRHEDEDKIGLMNTVVDK